MKYGPASFWLLVDGYNLTAMRLKQFSWVTESLTEQVTGLGDAAEVHAPVNMLRTEISQSGGFFDDATNQAHEALAPYLPSGPSAAHRILAFGVEGMEAGKRFIGCAGVYSHAYEVMAGRGELVKANAQYRVSGHTDRGVILQPLATQTADWNTEDAPFDAGAGSNDGGVGYLFVTACSGFTNFVAKIRDSSDGVTFADLIEFNDDVQAPYAQRVEVAGAVDRYLAFDGNVTGSGSITAMAGFSRR